MTFGMIVRVNHPGIDRLAHSPTGAGMRYLLTLGNRVLNNSRARVNVDTGYLRSTGVVEPVPDQAMVRVAYRANYARWVHDGTGSYPGNPYLMDAVNEEIGRI